MLYFNINVQCKFKMKKNYYDIEEDRIINEVVLTNYSFHYVQIEKEEIA